MTTRGTTGDHPSFPNPTIVEALCEVHFARHGESKPGWMGRVFKELDPDFPEMEPIAEAGVELRVSEPGFEQRFLPPRQKIRYSHPEHPYLIQLSERVFTLNVVGQYPGWHELSSRLVDYWARVSSVLQPLAVTRIGLRYINVIRRTSTDQPPRHWIKPNRYTAEAALDHPSGFLSRAQVPLTEKERLIVTLAERGPADESPNGDIVLDIDRISERHVESDASALIDLVTRLHEDVWKVFDSAKTKHLDARLMGEE